MRTRSRLLVGLLAACVVASCGGGSSTTGGTTDAGRTQATESDVPKAPPCEAADCEPQPQPEPQCTADDQCPSVRVACSVCPDGTSACPHAVCERGQCNVVVPSCPKPSGCGGNTSLPCAEGYVCVDDPEDRCDPDANGADCPGVCVPESKPRVCGGLAGDTCPPAYECVGDPSDECDPTTGGAECTGTCQPAQTGTCEADSDCAVFMAKCSTCLDGSASCPYSACVNGQCDVVVPACPTPSGCGGTSGFECKPGYQCVDDPNDRCEPDAAGLGCPAVCVPEGLPPPPQCGGFPGEACPEGLECIDDPSDECDPANGGADCTGVCQALEPPLCKSNDDCPQLRIACSVCPDGTTACPRSTCVNGQCSAVVPPCAAPNACGGIAGTPCQRGYECIDIPNDDCDSAIGADCPSMCTPEGPPPPLRCAGFAGAVCPEGLECVDDPSDDCDPTNGGADCGGLCRPAGSPQCKTDADCVVIAAPCELCADGTAACPRSFCSSDGQCAAVFERCAPTLQ